MTDQLHVTEVVPDDNTPVAKNRHYLIALNVVGLGTPVSQTPAMVYFPFDKIVAYHQTVLTNANFITALYTVDGKVWNVLESPDQISQMLSVVVLSRD